MKYLNVPRPSLFTLAAAALMTAALPAQAAGPTHTHSPMRYGSVHQAQDAQQSPQQMSAEIRRLRHEVNWLRSSQAAAPKER